jgi:hypothetical protein
MTRTPFIIVVVSVGLGDAVCGPRLFIVVGTEVRCLGCAAIACASERNARRQAPWRRLSHDDASIEASKRERT